MTALLGRAIEEQDSDFEHLVHLSDVLEGAKNVGCMVSVRSGTSGTWRPYTTPVDSFISVPLLPQIFELERGVCLKSSYALTSLRLTGGRLDVASASSIGRTELAARRAGHPRAGTGVGRRRPCDVVAHECSARRAREWGIWRGYRR